MDCETSAPGCPADLVYLEVAVAVPLDSLLTYSLSSALSLEEQAADGARHYCGRRVLVPLGNRRVTGYILKIAEPPAEKPAYTIRSIIKFLDEKPIFHRDLVDFFKWIAAYYHYPLGLVIKAALPGGLAPKTIKRIRLKTSVEQLLQRCGDDVPDWIYELADKKTIGSVQTSKLLANRADRELLEAIKNEGLIHPLEDVQKDAVGKKMEICYSPSGDLPLPATDSGITTQGLTDYQNIVKSATGLPIKVSEAKAVFHLARLSEKTDSGAVPLRDLRKIYGGIAKPLSTLTKSGVVNRSTRRVYRSPFGQQLPFYPRPLTLTPQQLQVTGEIIPAVQRRQYEPFLLHGITGCGKTEVYMRAAEKTLACGRDVIFLVPEIALATQLEAQLRSRFSDQVVLLHSGMSGAEKYDQYFLALSGRARIVIGARSAIFAPLKDPGLIIVDEEHDSSYKQDDTFRYHGRDLAVVRARHHSSVIILGSATPSVTSYNNATRGKYRLLTMDSRVGDSVLPRVRIVDLNQKKARVNSQTIGRELSSRLQENLSAKKQSILLLNRRGFSTALLCRDCGSPVQCEHCNVSLTLHKNKNRLICHYCGFSQTRDTTCVHCRSTDLVPAGFGTQRVEEEVCALLPDARVKRLDSDSGADRKKFMAILSEMHEKKIDILIGTQMIAKGHHFPHVTLVGVVWADGGMSMPDYKAAERTFQLITQVTGRAGRGEFPGEVIIQTLRPEHYAIQYARDHQYQKMYHHEMKVREQPLFPPYVRLILIRIKGVVQRQVEQSSVMVARFCRDYLRRKKSSIRVLGPAPSSLDKVRDNYRYQILIKGNDVNELHELCTRLRHNGKELVNGRCRLIIDVDPENMM